ncbi:MAG: PepSY domain-containing protein [Acidobacteria bacterium]|nr:PepSY domain-containing protein [Acidobacteriota bacterium]
MSKGHAVLRYFRKVHLYLGVFTTPALLFFAITGALQTFSLHESTQGSSYKPPTWLASLAQLHKKQNTTVPVRRNPHPVPGGAERNDNSPKVNQEAGKGLKDPVVASAGADSTRPEKTEAANEKKGTENSGAVAPRKSHLPMKIFFLLVAVSLALSSFTGLYMSYRYQRGRWQLTALLLAGLIVPLVLLPF